MCIRDSNSLQYGTLTLVGGETFQYENTSTLSFGDSAWGEEFYYIAKEPGVGGLTDVGQVLITLNAPGNTAPNFVTVPPANINIIAGVANVQTLQTNDPDGDNVEVSIVSYSGAGLGSLIPTVTSQGVLTVQGPVSYTHLTLPTKA